MRILHPMLSNTTSRLALLLLVPVMALGTLLFAGDAVPSRERVSSPLSAGVSSAGEELAVNVPKTGEIMAQRRGRQARGRSGGHYPRTTSRSRTTSRRGGHRPTRTHSSHHRGGRHYYRPHSYVHVGYGYYPWYRSHFFHPYYYWPPFYGPHYYGNYYGAYYASNAGAIDLNVKPKRAQVFLNGHYIGNTDKYDGFPSYLWLKRGTYEVIFYLDGHETVRKIYSPQPGVVIKERFHLNAGEAISPDKLSDPPQSTVAERRTPRSPDESHPRARRRYYRVKEEAQEAPVEDEALDIREDPGLLNLSVTPEDASIYLDGRFLGTGADLPRKRGLILDPGDHVLEITRPGWRPKKLEFSLKEGEDLQMNVKLDKV